MQDDQKGQKMSCNLKVRVNSPVQGDAGRPDLQDGRPE
jgi:hypothetical protein